VTLTREGADVLVAFPDFPVMTYGADEDEALARAVDALATYLMGSMANREEILAPRKRRGHTVTLPSRIEAKLERYKRKRAGLPGTQI
jgi:antitoxin HicB